jgi:hypothetical protein
MVCARAPCVSSGIVALASSLTGNRLAKHLSIRRHICIACSCDVGPDGSGGVASVSCKASPTASSAACCRTGADGAVSSLGGISDGRARVQAALGVGVGGTRATPRQHCPNFQGRKYGVCSARCTSTFRNALKSQAFAPVCPCRLRPLSVSEIAICR